MKSLYESILSSTGTGKAIFSKDNITGYISSSNLKDIINISKVKRVLKDVYGDPYTNYKCDAELVATLLSKFDYTRPEIELLRKNGNEISKVFKSKLEDFLHKRNKDKFEFNTTVGKTNCTVHIINAEGEEINWRTLFYYDISK